MNIVSDVRWNKPGVFVRLKLNVVSDVDGNLAVLALLGKKLGEIYNSQLPRIEVPRSWGNMSL